MSLPCKHIAEGIACAIMANRKGVAPTENITSECLRRTEAALRDTGASETFVVFLNPSMYARAEEEGYDMAGIIKTDCVRGGCSLIVDEEVK